MITSRPTIPPEVRAFLAAERFAVVGTVGADGTPHQAVAWYALQDDVLILNSAEGRRWPADLRHDPRVSVMISDGYHWVSLGGRVEIDEDQETAQADIAAMARRYHADDPAQAEDLIENRFRRQHRITFRLRPETVSKDL